VSMLECLAVTDHQHPVTVRSVAGRPGLRARFNPVPSIEPASDGWVAFMVVTGQQWLDFCGMIEQPGWADDAELARGAFRVSKQGELKPAIRAWTTTRTVDEIVEYAALFRIPAAPVGIGATIPQFEHLRETDAFVANPRSGCLQPRPGARIGGATAVLGPPPRLGEHTEQLRAKPARGTATTGVGAPQRNASTESLPLAGVRILDLTAFWAAPVITQPLALLGAEVIHVESTTRPDGMRMTSTKPFTDDHWWEFAPLYLPTSLGSRSTCRPRRDRASRGASSPTLTSSSRTTPPG